ncbi:MAG: succinylglutamate-semialdehyde dehydrogenase [Pseudomonadota bacterium]
MTDLLQLVDGEWRQGSGPLLVSTSPVDESELARGHAAGSEDVADAVRAAKNATAAWRKTSFEERRALVERFAAIAAERKEEMASLISQEAGKAKWDALTEAGAIAGKAGLALSSYDERTPTREKEQGALKLRITHKPHGVMVVIGPFNFPGHLPNGQIIPSLVAGNTVVFKPSEQTPAVGTLMARWWKEAGAPAGVINVVHGDRQVAEGLIKSPGIAGVLFTGGINAGRAIHETMAGRPEVIVALELGGNNPIVAWDIENVDDAAQIVIRSAYITTGQRCTCARRLIVEDGPNGQKLIDAVQALIPRLRVGPPEAEPEPFMGPLVSATSAERALSAQAKLIEDGAKPLTEMAQADAGAAYVTPGLLDVTDMPNDPDEEIFAPLLKVIRVKSFDEAIERANDTQFGLAASLLSDSEELWQRFDAEIVAGIVNWNRQTTGASGSMPFGGPGLSGNHRPAGSYAADFCAWPMASMLAEGPLADDQPVKGLNE